jgi:hypothetical protein
MAARRLEDDACQHQPRCPAALAADRAGARAVASHPEQGWSLLCNGVVLFDDGGALLPGGRAVAPADMRQRGPRDGLSAREPAVSGERMMARKVTAQARENREYVRSLLKVKQPEFAAAPESAVGVLSPVLSGHGMHRGIRLQRHPGTGRLAPTGRTPDDRRRNQPPLGFRGAREPATLCRGPGGAGRSVFRPPGSSPPVSR